MAIREIARGAQSTALVVERSTVPVETGKHLKHLLSVYSPNPLASFHVAANPQFLREGEAVEEFLHPDRILLGAEDAPSERVLREVYRPIVQHTFQCPMHAQACPPCKSPELLITSVQSAELIKHVSNAFLAVKISYANVLADLCERIGANVQEVTHAMGLDSRIGTRFLSAGLGFGGSRLPNDLQAFCRLVERANVDAGIFHAAENVNRARVEAVLEKVTRSLWVVKDKQIGLLGLAHKANTDDIRHSPGVALAQRLAAAGAVVRVYDPRAMPNTAARHPDFILCQDEYDAAKGADALLIATDWEEFAAIDWRRVHGSMLRPLVIDGRNLLSPAAMKSIGFEYISIGRPA
jgi:UDPglucose 6-dehydrogenase